MSFTFKKIAAIALFTMVSVINTQAQSKPVSDTLHVSGNCSMCKKRIEEAAYIKGVKQAEWNKNTRVLSLVYLPAKTNKQQITKAILAAGHDASSQKASDSQYQKLPSCCAYRTGTCEH